MKRVLTSVALAATLALAACGSDTSGEGTVSQAELNRAVDEAVAEVESGSRGDAEAERG